MCLDFFTFILEFEYLLMLSNPSHNCSSSPLYVRPRGILAGLATHWFNSLLFLAPKMGHNICCWLWNPSSCMILTSGMAALPHPPAPLTATSFSLASSPLPLSISILKDGTICFFALGINKDGEERAGKNMQIMQIDMQKWSADTTCSYDLTIGLR